MSAVRKAPWAPVAPVAPSVARAPLATRAARAAVALLALAPLTGLQAQATQSYAIRGATIYTLAGAPWEIIENGTVIIENGRITAVGVDVPVPAGAQVVDASGLQIYPGLFNAFSNMGLSEINAVGVTNDEREMGNFNPHLQAATAVHPASERIPVTRANGITHVVSAPSSGGGGGFGGGGGNGNIAGQASAIHLDGWTIEEMLIDESVGIVLSWPSIQTRTFDRRTFSRGSRPFTEAKRSHDESVERLAGWLDSARRYRLAVEAGQSITRDLRLEALARVTSGELPFLITADSERDIREAVEFAEEQGVRMILVSGRDAWMAKELLAEKDVPVLMRATQNTPSNADDPFDRTFTAARELWQAGVRLAQVGYGSAGPNPPSRTLAYEAANTVAFGLPWEEALKSITLYPAQILGLDNDLGSVEVGKIANLIVTDGDPMEIRTQITHVFINGLWVDTDNKHKQLYEKYRARN